MNADEFADLFPHARGADFTYHTGIVRSWNFITGENIVEVLGAPIENLPILNIGDSINLRIGVAVGVLKFRSTYFILGRIMVPNTTQFLDESGTTVPIAAGEDTFAITTTPTARAVNSVITVPAWATGMRVNFTVHSRCFNASGATRHVDLVARANGFDGGLVRGSVGNNAYGSVSAGFGATLDVLPNSDVTVAAVISADATIASTAWNAVFHHGWAAFI